MKKIDKFPFTMGQIILSIEGCEKYSDCATFTMEDGRKILMYHKHQCCESVYIEDVVGDVSDLIGIPLTMAEEINDADNTKIGKKDSFTWTFYKFATARGYVTIRWYGTSNGYYSESVDFAEV